MVRQDSHTDLAADGDYMIPTINANGEIRVTSTAASGGATEAKQDDMETTLDAILAKNSEIETTNNANQVLLGTIDSDTDAIKTSAAALVVDLAAIEVINTNAEAHLGEIEGAVETLEACVSSSILQVNQGNTFGSVVNYLTNQNVTSSGFTTSVITHTAGTAYSFSYSITAGSGVGQNAHTNHTFNIHACLTSDGTYQAIDDVLQIGSDTDGLIHKTRVDFPFWKLVMANSGAPNIITLKYVVMN